jgi:hypothetical protein
MAWYGNCDDIRADAEQEGIECRHEREAGRARERGCWFSTSPGHSGIPFGTPITVDPSFEVSSASIPNWLPLFSPSVEDLTYFSIEHVIVFFLYLNVFIGIYTFIYLYI